MEKLEQKLVSIWGRDLYDLFGHHMDEEGWLTSDWHLIIDEEIPRYHKDTLRDNELYSFAYGRMYNIDYEVNSDETKIRRTDNPSF